MLFDVCLNAAEMRQNFLKMSRSRNGTAELFFFQPEQINFSQTVHCLLAALNGFWAYYDYAVYQALRLQ